MINKKGFTLIELLAVIAIIGLISLIAVPNIIGISSGVKKDQMLADAKKLISLAQYKIKSDITLRNSNQIFTLNDLNFNSDIGSDPDGGSYDGTLSKVKYSIDGGEAEYSIILIGSKRQIGDETNWVKETELHSRSNVVDRQD